MAVSCPSKGIKGFTRSDKLYLHLRSHHTQNTPFLCPVSECDVGPFPPDLFWVHLNWHNSDVQRVHKSQIRSLEEMCFPCPVQGCNKNIAATFFRQPHHPVFHDLDTRKRDASAILAAGYFPTSGLPICPTCNIEFDRDRYWSDADIKHLLSHGWESLYENRREILRVQPWFGRKAEFQQVFEDILPTVDARQRR